MKYCCKMMGELDRKQIIDYCEPHLTTLDVGKWAYPMNYCPFCGKHLVGTSKSLKRINDAMKWIKKNRKVK